MSQLEIVYLTVIILILFLLIWALASIENLLKKIKELLEKGEGEP